MWPRALATLMLLGGCLAARPALPPTPTPAPAAAAERLYARVRAAWRAGERPPYLRFGALVRYTHGEKRFDAWWDGYERSSDDALAFTELHDADAENRRLRGGSFGLFGLKLLDTNGDAAPISVEAPAIPPTSSFGILGRGAVALAPPIAVSGAPGLREITSVTATARDYAIAIAGTETVDGAAATHLVLTPLRSPGTNRLRDVWFDPATDRTVRLDVQGILRGKPYDAVRWTVHYVTVDGGNYIGRIAADEPLRFGATTTVPSFEIDYVDYHFPADVPPYTFSGRML